MGLANAAQLLLAPAPAVVWDQLCRSQLAGNQLAVSSTSLLSRIFPSCEIWHQRPLASVNSLLVWNMCVVFWALSLVQGSTWVRVYLETSQLPRPRPPHMQNMIVKSSAVD